MADIKLVFPELSGVERGAKLLAQDFKSKPLYYLARESIQNSLDAWTKVARAAGKPARVVFRLHEIPKSKVTCRDEILKAFERAEKYWESRQSMFQPIWDAARSSLTSDKVRILEISDYNTCGLEGDDRKVGGRWHSLVKSEGVPNPNAAAGGSYGIGKMAPFACSDARTVLYSTKTEDGHAFQGVCRLATFEQDRVRRAPDGFIGLDTGPKSEPYLAVRKEKDIPALFQRSEIGTSVWCLGFIKQKNWLREVVSASLDSFWLAIHLGHLEVDVIDERGESISINKKRLLTRLSTPCLAMLSFIWLSVRRTVAQTSAIRFETTTCVFVVIAGAVRSTILRSWFAMTPRGLNTFVRWSLLLTKIGCHPY